MHRHHAFGRQVVVERREHRLLHLAGVVAAADQDHALGEVERDHRLAAHAMTLRVGLERRQAEDGEIGNVVREIRAIRADQQRADEQRVPREFGEDARLDAIFRVGAAKEVLRENFLALGVLEEIVEQQIELRRRQLAVLFPPDRLFGGLVADDEFVFRRAAGVNAGLGTEGAAFDDVAFLVGDRVFVKRRLGEIPVNGGKILEAEFVGAMGAITQTCFLHGTSS